MSIIRRNALNAEELLATRDLVSVYHRVCSIRGRQVAQVQSELEATEKAYVPCENACERLCAELGKMGFNVSRYDQGVDTALSEIRRLKYELDEHQKAMKVAGVTLPEEMPF